MVYLIEKTVSNNIPAKAIWDKADLNEALMALHQVMASAMASQNVTSALAMIIDERGATLKHEYWERT